MQTNEELKQVVKEKYTAIAQQDKLQNAGSCCGSGCCSDENFNIMSDNYSDLEGYNPDADLGLGCGLPTEFAKISEGDIVIDLGSGAGNDCFIARKQAGESGKVIGIDFTDTMINLARKNAEKLKYHNVEFRNGDIENIPATGNYADVVISNCVLNLVPDKQKVFSEIFRILKPGAHFSISDIVLEGVLHPKIKSAAEMYAGCVTGAIQKNEYLKIIENAGFKNITVQKSKPIIIPDTILLNYLTRDEIIIYKSMHVNITSITVYAEKDTSCCDGDCCLN